MSPRDLYAVLGIKKDATSAEVKTAYRKLAKANHPDRNPGNKRAEERFKEASAAFEILGDPEKRAAYDEFGADSIRSGFDPAQARSHRTWQEQAARAARGYQSRGGGTGPGGIDLEDLFGGSRGSGGFSFSDLGGSFSDLFGGGRPRPDRAAGPQKGEDVDTQISISFRKAVLGGETQIRVVRPDRAKPQQLSVKIPVGLRDGQKIRLAGQGAASPRGGKPGDLLITVKVRADPLFERVDDDLLLVLPVTVGEAMRGATLEVPTLDGSVKLKVPPGSQSGNRLRLKGKGVPARGNRDAGYLFVELRVEVPEPKTVDAKLDAALDELERSYRKDLRAAFKLRKKP